MRSGCLKFELTFRLDREVRNPFDSSAIYITANVVAPSGNRREIPAFYFQDYARSKVLQYCKKHRAREYFEKLTPRGRPRWKVRFAPTETGTYRYWVSVNGRKTWPEEGVAEFKALPSSRPGFIRVARDRRHFEFSNGKSFYPVGPNLRSPTDNRNIENYAPYFQQQWHLGTYLYDDYFKAMEAHELNWARVWQCSWWLGLEWTRLWHGYQGLGRYNLENAWRLDYLLDLAEKSGIYLQVDTANHGMFSLDIDREWDLNPFNQRNPADRGPLLFPRQFFTEEAGRWYFANRIRYTAARWGYSTHLFAWTVMTECEFTDDYWTTAAKLGESGRHPTLVRWHQFSTSVFKNGDPNHLVTTHFSHPFRGHDVFDVPGCEFVESNTYWQDWKYRKMGGPPKDTPWIVHTMFHRFMGTHHKPVLVGEYGGHIKRNTPATMDIELHVGAWAMVVEPYAGCTGYWWWPWLHHRNRYSQLRAVSRFIKGEDRRGKNLRSTSPAVSRGLVCRGLQNEVQADLWVHHRELKRTMPENLPTVRGATVFLRGLRPGTYRVEFWDTNQGIAVSSTQAEVKGSFLNIQLPPLKGDLAAKVRQRE